MPLQAELELVKRRDRDFPDERQAVLQARMVAVIAAQRACRQRVVGAWWALRQSLIDLAAIAELLAADLPAPDLEG